MKNIFKSTAAIVIYTVIITLGVLYGTYRVYQWGHGDGVRSEQSVNARIQGAITKVSKQ